MVFFYVSIICISFIYFEDTNYHQALVRERKTAVRLSENTLHTERQGQQRVIDVCHELPWQGGRSVEDSGRQVRKSILWKRHLYANLKDKGMRVLEKPTCSKALWLEEGMMSLRKEEKARAWGLREKSSQLEKARASCLRCLRAGKVVKPFTPRSGILKLAFEGHAYPQ